MAKSPYDRAREEVVAELRRDGISFSFEGSKLTDSESVVKVGFTLRKYTEKMVEIALVKIGKEQKYSEIGRSLETIAQLFADHKIEITITEKTDAPTA